MANDAPLVSKRSPSRGNVDADLVRMVIRRILAVGPIRRLAGHGWTLYLRYRAFITALPWNQVYYVDPEALTHVAGERFRSYSSSASIVDGEWDRDGVRPFDDLITTRSLRQRFNQAAPWPDTDLYVHLCRRLNDGVPSWGCTSHDRILAHLSRIDRLYASIVADGYQPRSSAGHGIGYNVTNEVSVAIGSDGTILFADGRHRLAIAKLLTIRELPVQVSVVHRDWYLTQLQRLPDSRWRRIMYRIRCTTGAISWEIILARESE